MALDALTDALRPYVEDRLRATHGDDWVVVVRKGFQSDRQQQEIPDDIAHWDAHALLSVMWDHWNAVFRRHLGLFERSLVAELRAFRNRWAHQKGFNFDDTYRLLDSVQRLLTRIEASNVSRISELKFEILREEFGESINSEAREKENRRERWVAAGVYASCGSVFVYLIPNTMNQVMPGNPGIIGAVTTAVTLGFAYLIYMRVKHRPIQVGPHECRRCRRIIYGTSCPYCSSPPIFDSAEFRVVGSEAEDEALETRRPLPR
jgi:hypothetical protein